MTKETIIKYDYTTALSTIIIFRFILYEKLYYDHWLSTVDFYTGILSLQQSEIGPELQLHDWNEKVRPIMDTRWTGHSILNYKKK